MEERVHITRAAWRPRGSGALRSLTPHTHTHTHTHKTRHTSVVYSAAPLPVLLRRADGTPRRRMCTHTQHEKCHTHSRHTSHMTSLTALPRTAYRTRVCFLSALISSYQLSYCPAAPHPCSSASAAWVTAARCLPLAYRLAPRRSDDRASCARTLTPHIA